MGRKKAKPRTAGPIAPPLTDFVTLESRGAHSKGVLGMTAGRTGNARDNLKTFLERQGDDPPTGRFGSWEDLADVHVNSASCEKLIRDVDSAVTRSQGSQTLNRCERAQAAAANIIASSYAIDSATLLLCRRDAWPPLFAASVIRTALELAANAALIASGTSDEPHSWENATRNFTSREQMSALYAVLQAGNSTCMNPTDLYKWLCNFTHLNSKGLSKIYMVTGAQRLDFQEVIAKALAYVSWALAEVTLLVTGLPRNAAWPKDFSNAFVLPP